MHYSSVFLGVNLGLGFFVYVLGEGEVLIFGGFSSARPTTPCDFRDVVTSSTRTNRFQCN